MIRTIWASAKHRIKIYMDFFDFESNRPLFGGKSASKTAVIASVKKNSFFTTMSQ